MKTTVLQIDVFEKIYDFLIENPISLLLIPVFWLGIMYVYKEQFGRLTPWIVGFCLIVAVLLTIGVVMLFI